MDQPQQPQGNFVMNLNYKRGTNPDAPAITGRISTPDEPEAEYSFSAFEQTDRQGERYWIGPVSMNRNLRQALNQAPERGTHFVAIRENSFKTFATLPDGQPNPAYAALTAEARAKEDAKPSYWATWTRTPELPQIRCSAWERETGRYGPWASGNTQYPLSKDEAAALKAGRMDEAALTAPEPTPQPAPRGRAKATETRAGR